MRRGNATPLEGIFFFFSHLFLLHSFLVDDLEFFFSGEDINEAGYLFLYCNENSMTAGLSLTRETKHSLYMYNVATAGHDL